jgi:hypothetical protein
MTELYNARPRETTHTESLAPTSPNLKSGLKNILHDFEYKGIGAIPGFRNPSFSSSTHNNTSRRGSITRSPTPAHIPQSHDVVDSQTAYEATDENKFIATSPLNPMMKNVGAAHISDQIPTTVAAVSSPSSYRPKRLSTQALFDRSWSRTSQRRERESRGWGEDLTDMGLGGNSIVVERSVERVVVDRGSIDDCSRSGSRMERS